MSRNLDSLSMDIINAILQRKSCRTYNPGSLKPSDRKLLQEFIDTHKTGINNESVDFILVEKNETEVPMKIPYGLITGNKTYILGKTLSTPIARTNYGYMLERIVLKATEMKLGTCWVGLFDKEYFNDIQVEKELDIPSILVIGYAQEKMPVKEKLIRKAVNADKRKPWETLFFNYESGEVLSPESVQPYEETLKMTRLAPSAGNTQPWRIFYSTTGNEFHFYKKPINKSYDEKGMHDIDMGIAMCHFELVSAKNGLKGNWTKYPEEQLKLIDGLEYISTWKCD
ncbi:MAG TPA: nitroreductase family protein [Paludibacter sp.]